MNWLLDNFQILLVLGLALAAWLKNRAEANQEAEAERRAREEMIRGMEEARRNSPTTRPQTTAETRRDPSPEPWDTRPVEEPRPAPPPPPEPVAEQPPVWRQAEPMRQAEPAPWAAAPQAEPQDELLKRQQAMQDKLAEIKRATEKVKQQVGGARATQRQLERRHQPEKAFIPLGSLRGALRDKRQVKRAVVLREILGPPIGLR